MTIFTGKTEEAAIAAGVAALNSTRAQVTTKVIKPARKGWFGLGHRDAAVDVVLKAVAAPAAQPVAPAAQPVAPAQPTASASKPTAAEPAPQSTPTTPTPAPAEAAAPRPQRTPAQNRAHREAAIEAVQDYVLEIVTQLGIDATVSAESLGHRQVRLAFETEKEGLLIGKHGRTINALQSLAQLFLNHHGAAHVVVELDVANYRERRQATLARLADNTAREVVATGKPIYLDPMPSFERKQIHAALAQNHYVTTYSAGKEPHRAVVIEPV